MLKKNSKAIAEWLVQIGAISEHELELYEYATYTFVFNLMPFVMAIIVGVIFAKVPDCLLIILPFVFVRKYSGGFHFKSPLLCVVCSTILLGLACYGINFVIQHDLGKALSVLVFVSIIGIYCFSPINSDDAEQTKAEKKKYKLIASLIMAIFIVAYFLLRVMHLSQSAPLGVGILLPMVLQWPVITKQIIGLGKRKRE
ncbi:MAG: accessory gene regulator B family protein [Oscillospiraceae bacterium]|nr:accessory gene regulator B family protein [Oscillospiraceae bacterium]